MKDFIEKIQGMLTEEHYKDFIPVKPSVCRECTDCCSDLVPFEMTKIKMLKKKHRKLFRGIKLVPKKDMWYIKRTSAGKGKCIFLKNSECLIYEDRPPICKYFGSSPIMRCGLEGLDVCPPQFEKDRLARIAQEESLALMESMFDIHIPKEVMG